MKSRTSKMSTVRAVIQILFFIFLPGLVSETFNGFKVLVQGMMTGNIDIFFFQQTMCTIIIIIGTFFLGRFFCGFICAFGALGDFFHFFGSKVFKINFKINNSLDSYLKIIKYLVLVFIVVVMWTGSISWFDTWSPWDAFGMLNSFPPNIMYALNKFTVGTILFFAFMIGSMFIERFFCRYFCPLGAILSIISLFRVGRIKKPREGCGKCRICTKNCSMGIELYKTDDVHTGECIDCMKCVSPCPRKNVSFEIFEKKITPYFFVIASFMVMAVYLMGTAYINTYETRKNSVNTPTETENMTVQPSDNVEGQANAQTETPVQNTSGYIDGTYEGSGIGYKGRTTTVAVTIENGKIVDIQTVSTGDDGHYYKHAFSSVTSQIISEQSTSVDTVSGATFSCNGIMSAVSDAVLKAEQ